MRKDLLIIYFIALFTLSVCCITDIKAALKDNDWDYDTKITKTESGFQYFAHPSKDGKEAWIYAVKGNFYTRNITLSIPKTIDGRNVTRLGEASRTEDYPLNIISVEVVNWSDTSAYYTNRIKKVVLPDTIEVIEPYTFAGLHRLETIRIPKKVTKINEYTFYECKRLKKVILPEKLKKLEPLAFFKCPNLKKLQLSSKNKIFKLKSGRFLITRKNNALAFAAGGGCKTLNIPNGIKIIKQNACNTVAAPVVNIPASVQKIKERAFGCQIKDVTVDANNKVFQKDGQCIYRIKDKSLAVAIVDENLNLRISDMVEKLTPEYSRINYNEDEESPENVILPSNLKTVKGTGLYVAKASNIYFTSATPPEIIKTKNLKRAVFPFFTSVHVPKASLKVYKSWYKKYVNEDRVDWNTYDGSVPEIETD